MIYTEQTKKALNLCYRAHAGQVDKGGMPYVFHPVHLAEQMDDELSTVVALLHDVVEDTEYTFEDLLEMGFAEEAVEALKLLTHDKAVAYQDYVQNLSGNPIARKVKMADLTHNLDTSRQFGDPSMYKGGKSKYQKALRFLQDVDRGERADYSIPCCPVSDEELTALKRMKNNKYRDQIRGSLIAGAAGDALGYEVEFDYVKEIFHRFGPGGISSYVPHKGFARISDDTQMTMYTAIGLLFGTTRMGLRGIGAPLENYIYQAYLDWLETQKGPIHKNRISWLNNMQEMYALRAPGGTCLRALRSGDMGSVQNPINDSKGCGGVMRVAPVGLYFKNTREFGEYDHILQIMELAGEAAAITHGHPLGYIPAAALAQIISRIVYGGCKYGRNQSAHLPANILRECKELLVELYGDTEYTDQMNRLIDQAATLAANDRPDVENIHAIGGGWVGDEALAIAIYCWLRYPTDLDKALVAAVNHNGDSDSTGAILGNILGAALGYEAIDPKWKKGLELHGALLELADDLCDECRMSEFSSFQDEAWLSKYVQTDFVPKVIHG